VYPGSIPGRSIHNPPNGTDPGTNMATRTITETTPDTVESAIASLKVGDTLEMLTNGAVRVRVKVVRVGRELGRFVAYTTSRTPDDEGTVSGNCLDGGFVFEPAWRARAKFFSTMRVVSVV